MPLPGGGYEGEEREAAVPMRCVAVIDSALPRGRAANAAAVMALTLGQRQPQLVGESLVDGAGEAHPGLIPLGIPVLGAAGEDLPRLRDKARAAGLEVVDFPVQGQETTDYAAFRRRVSETDVAALRYLGVMIYGERKKVGRLVGRFGLLQDGPGPARPGG